MRDPDVAVVRRETLVGWLLRLHLAVLAWSCLGLVNVATALNSDGWMQWLAVVMVAGSLYCAHDAWRAAREVDNA